MNTPNPKIILVDQDGVLANYTKAHLEAIAHEFPELKPLQESECTRWNTEDHFPENYRARIEALALRPGFFRSLEPFPGAVEALHDLVRNGYDVRICTAPKRDFTNCVGEKFAWVKEHLGQSFVERMIVTRDKTLVHGDMLIDDKPDVSGLMTPSWTHVVFDQPYNKNSTQPRVTWQNYQEVLGL